MIPLEQIGHMAFNPITAHLYHKLGPTLCMLSGSLVALSGLYASTYVTYFPLFVLLYGGLYGVGIGMSYMAPLMCGWEHYPERKGLVSGVIIGGFGFGSFIFDIISTMLVNPDDKNPSIEVIKSETT